MNDSPTPVTVETLLRLKRAEAPAPEFWTEFERDLRARQLGAIVEKRPWWCSLPKVYVFVLRRRMPLTAAAVMAFALLSYRQFPTQGSERVSPLENQPIASAPSSASAVATPAVVPAAGAATETRVSSARPAAVVDVPESRIVRPAMMSATALAPVAMLDAAPARETTDRFDNLSHSMAADLAIVPAPAHPLLGGMHSFDAHLASASLPAAEPLAQMMSPSAERRSRLLEDAFPASSARAAMVTPASDRVASGLSDDRINDSGISRYDLAGERDLNSSSIKFSIRL